MGWLSGFSYRKSHVINSASGAGTNYQVKIKVYYGNGTDSGENVYLNGKCKTDFGDIRFTRSDGETLLDYWMEEKVDSDYTVFWVEVADDLSSSNATIYIYYGNPAVTTTSNGANTFLLFDDFDGTDIDFNKWTLIGDTGISYSVSNSLLRFWQTTVGSRERNPSHNLTVVSDNYMFEARCRTESDDSTLYYKVGVLISNENAKSEGVGSASNLVYMAINRWGPVENRNWRCERKVNGVWSDVAHSGEGVTTNWRVFGIARIGTTFYVFKDYEQKASTTITTISNNYIMLFDRFYSANKYNTFDWARVRKYVSPEPSHGSWGSEEVFLAQKPYLLDVLLSSLKTKSYLADLLLSSRRTGSYIVDVSLFSPRTGSYLADVCLSSLGEGSYSIDVSLSSLRTESYNIDVYLSSSKTKSYITDVLLSILQTKSYTADVALSSLEKRSYLLDVPFSSLREESFIIDVPLSTLREESYAVDVCLSSFRTGSYTVDVPLSSLRTGSYLIDLYLLSLRKESYLVDVPLLSSSKGLYIIDIVLSSLETGSYIVDVPLSSFRTESYIVDVCLSSLRAESYNLDVPLSSLRTGSYNIDVCLSSLRTGSYAVDVYLSSLPRRSYIIDVYLSSLRIGSYLIDVPLSSLGKESYIIDVYLSPLRRESYILDVLFSSLRTRAYVLDVYLSSIRKRSYTVDVYLSYPPTIRSYSIDVYLFTLGENFEVYPEGIEKIALDKEKLERIRIRELLSGK